MLVYFHPINIYIYIYIPSGRLGRRRFRCIHYVFGGVGGLGGGGFWGGVGWGGVITSCRALFFGCKYDIISMFAGWKCYVIVMVCTVEMLRYRYGLQGGIATLSLCFQGGNATLSLCLQGGNATLSLCLQGGNATLSLCLQGGNATLSLCLH